MIMLTTLPKEIIFIVFLGGLGILLGLGVECLKRCVGIYEKKRSKVSKDMETWDKNFPHDMENKEF